MLEMGTLNTESCMLLQFSLMEVLRLPKVICLNVFQKAEFWNDSGSVADIKSLVYTKILYPDFR